MRKLGVVVLATTLVVAGVLVFVRSRSADKPSTVSVATAVPNEPATEGFEEGGDPDAAAANHVGTTRVRNRILAPATLAATGWAGEVQVANEDTWEPSVVADPSSSYVYTLYNRYGITCHRCPNPQMEIRISADNGQTWAPEKPICTCTGVAGQYDPVLATTMSGAIYATWMNYNIIVFSKSTDHGATWSTPLKVSGKSWADKPWLGVSATGTDVYVGYESRSELQMTSSHNSGTSFSAPISVNTDSSVYRYPNGFAVLASGANGTAIMSDSKYNGGSVKTSGPVDIEVWRTTNGGASWSKVIVDSTLFTGVNFETSSTTTVAADSAGKLVAEYSGATSQGTVTRLFTKRSTDGGVTWSARTEVGTATANGSFPAIAAKGAGDFRLTYMDNSTGAWNVWYRASTDGGVSWSAPLRVSDATSGTSYKTANGFTSYYGDYDAIAITNVGKSVIVSGQGASFSTGPGSIWFNRQI
ncbi:MAG: sialidase family protein [Actinomycetota bacterium]